MQIYVKSSLPKHLKNGSFLCKSFRPFIKYLPANFILEFCKEKTSLLIVNPTTKTLTINGNTAIGSITFNLSVNLSNEINRVKHFHTDMDHSISFCTLDDSKCPLLSSKFHNNHCYSNHQPCNKSSIMSDY